MRLVVVQKKDQRRNKNNHQNFASNPVVQLFLTIAVLAIPTVHLFLSAHNDKASAWEDVKMVVPQQWDLFLAPSSSNATSNFSRFDATPPVDDSFSSSAGSHIPILPVVSKPTSLPNLTDIVQLLQTQQYNATTAAQYILDVAIVGFAKCGTTTMMNWLGSHPQIAIPNKEIRLLKHSGPSDLVKLLYDFGGDNAKLLRGYKSPSDIIDRRPIRLLGQFFPQTKLIVGIRHPIRMMESFYNHRVQNQFDIKPFDQLGYMNVAKSRGVHFSRAEYHVHLATLGRTNVSTPEEQNLFPKGLRKKFEQNLTTAVQSPNPVFLFDTLQLADSNATRLADFQQDLMNFLGLNQPLSPPLHVSPGREQPTDVQAKIDSKKIRICDDRYLPQRNHLLDMGFQTQEWILRYFLQSPSVYVSNRDHFQKLVRDYMFDPCEKDKE